MAIQEAFNFDADHLYFFFMSGKAWDDSDFRVLPSGGERQSSRNENEIGQFGIQIVDLRLMRKVSEAEPNETK
jgi:hypothetical protein